MSFFILYASNGMDVLRRTCLSYLQPHRLCRLLNVLASSDCITIVVIVSVVVFCRIQQRAVFNVIGAAGNLGCYCCLIHPFGHLFSAFSFGGERPTFR